MKYYDSYLRPFECKIKANAYNDVLLNRLRQTDCSPMPSPLQNYIDMNPLSRTFGKHVKVFG